MNIEYYSNYIQNCSFKMTLGTTISNLFTMKYGIIPNDVYEATVNLEGYPPVKGLPLIPLIDLDNNITGLFFLDIFNDKEILIGCGYVLLNKNKLNDEAVLITEDKYAAFKISATKYSVYFLKKADKDLVLKIKEKWKNLSIVVACHEQNDFRRRLHDINIRVLGLSEPVTAYSDPIELQNEIEYLISNTSIKQWDNPKEIKTTLSMVQPLTKSMLPSVMWDYISDEAIRADNMSIDFVAVCTLVSCGSVVGTKVAVKPKQKDDWTIIPNLWGAIVAPPSSRKTPALNAGMKPLNMLAEKARVIFDQKVKEHAVNKILLETKDKGLKENLKQASKKGDQVKVEQISKELIELMGVSEDYPIMKRYKTNDATPEALAELEKSNPDGILVCRDELVGLLTSLENGKDEGNRTFFLEGWNGGGSYEFDRILRGNGFIKNHCLSVLGGIQPDRLIQYLEPSIKGSDNDGLIQRFQLMVCPDIPRWQYKDEYPNYEARNALFNLFESIDKIGVEDLVAIGAFPINEFNSIPYFRFDSEAQQKFIEWTTNLNEHLIPNEAHPIIAEHLTKYGKLLPALALIFHLIECLLHGYKGQINKRSIEMAIDWCDYLESHARRIYGLVLQGSGIRAVTLSERLLRLEDQHEWKFNGFTSREVQRKNWKGLTTPESVTDALDVLVEHKWLVLEEIESSVRGGRPTKRYWINPKIYENR
ncbi:DUF3987 domain-containing protein [Acinetobacter schindleri]|uniref:YfjI family protein n=1 Tax=Acinetobacter schindleri TaxID=108981 RepID=UPI0013B09EF1|nr:YfjI family protein [Acinetobacter schindleri]QIC60259.1 DUF3987 domain-containing protein [Acinetobacter schindleri]